MSFPGKDVQFQLSRGKQSARLFGWSIALFSKHNERCDRQYLHEPPPAFALLRQGSPSFKSLLKPLSRSRNIDKNIDIDIDIYIHVHIHRKNVKI